MEDLPLIETLEAIGLHPIVIEGGSTMKDIAKNWDILPISRKIEIAKAAGIHGRFGSSSWKDLHEIDKKAILRLYQPKEQLIKPIQISPRDKSFIETGRRVHEDITSALELPSSVLPKDETPPVPQDYLLWVGWGSYPTIKSFLAEANTMGVSRRISKIPRDLVLGKSKIFLAHDEGETGDAVIFGYFVPTGIEMIIFDATTINNGLRKDITPVTLEEAGTEDERGCGSRVDVGSIYLVSRTDEETIRQISEKGLAEDTQLTGAIVILKPPKDYNAIINMNGRRFRGIKKVDGQKILSGKTKKEPSLRHKVSKYQKMPRKRGDKWSPEEMELLRKLTSEMRPRRAFREMMKITGRSLPTMEWHYRKIREEEKES